jgi:aromatic ring-opening dioxygenase catalytic subunit (LigB family)
MSAHTAKELSPVLFLPHGGGPLPLLGDKSHESLITFLKNIPLRLGTPDVILLISAHWEEKNPTLTGSEAPALIYDYYGFPDEAYQLQYAAEGRPKLAKEIKDLFESSGIRTSINQQRGYDHGMYVPLLLMYPLANIPCVQLSLQENLDPEFHIELGKSLSSLRKQNVLIIGSGLSFHNMQVFFSPAQSSKKQSVEFDDWLMETCASDDLSSVERENRLINWTEAPSARFCHPREEHLMPLHVCFGAACETSSKAEIVFNDDILGHRATGFIWN